MLEHSPVLGTRGRLTQKADKSICVGPLEMSTCRHVDMSRSRAPLARMLLPRGAGRLRDDLGKFLKDRRQGRLGHDQYGTQAQIAARVGVSRQTLSDIDRGAAWPGATTLDLLLDALELGWGNYPPPTGYKAETAPRMVWNGLPPA
ncbi:helix-turn-helix domain-containing protein, partial [Sphingomonas sp. 10B4]